MIVALYPAATLWNSRQQASANAASLTATGLPLLAAELPGYRITQAGAEKPGDYITYNLVPDSAPPELTPSPTTDSAKIYVVISRAGPLFAPSAHCASATGAGPYVTLAGSPPCQPSGHGLWVQRRGNLNVVFARHGDAVVELDADAFVTPEATVLRAAEDLVPRGASDFPSGP